MKPSPMQIHEIIHQSVRANPGADQQLNNKPKEISMNVVKKSGQTVVTVRLRRIKNSRYYSAEVVGGAFDGKHILLRAADSERRRWAWVARYDAMINVPVESERLEAKAVWNQN
jgi:hypothetical protein